MSKKTIYLARHGQTVANTAEQTQGPDDPLNETGIEQANLLAERAKQLDFEKIVSTDYARGKDTAEIIGRATNKPILLSPLFREFRRPSEFWNRIPKTDPEVLAGYKLMQEHFFEEGWHFSDEENFFDLKQRGQLALEHLLRQEEERMLVVSHGQFSRCLLGLMLRGDNYSPQDFLDIETTFSVNNTSITVAKYMYHWRRETDTWMISRWNDDAHLGEI